MDEVCIVLDVDDNPIGSASKKTCMLYRRHLWEIVCFIETNH